MSFQIESFTGTAGFQPAFSVSVVPPERICGRDVDPDGKVISLVTFL
jgi:hypothetical protein